MTGTPLGILLSLIGLFLDRPKSAALVGLAAGLLIAAMMFVTALC